MTTPHLTGRKYLRAADQRLQAAQLLLRNDFGFEAVYLAGYVVECALKALILSRTPLARQDHLVRDRFRGRSGHDYDVLRDLLRSVGVVPPREIVAGLVRVATWSTDLRYEVGVVPIREAQRFVAAAQEVAAWAKRSI